MFSKKSQYYFSSKDKVRYNIFKKRPNLKKYVDLLKKGNIPRPHYALGILMAAHQAYKLGYNPQYIINNLNQLLELV
jgi:hypothetical protein